MNEKTLDKTIRIVNLLHKIAVIIAIIVGGFWTYKLFILHREAYPKANISYHIEERKLSDEYNFIQVFVKIENSGNTVLKLRRGDVRLYDISFPNENIERALREFGEPAFRKKAIFDWTTIQFVKIEWPEGKIEIEPSEADQLDFEFIIPSQYKVIKIYSWFTDMEKKVGEETIGWRASRLYNLKH
jgi:hypothetical protein